MNDSITHIHQRTSKQQKHIVFAEGDDPRVRKAANYLVDKQICEVTLIGSQREPVLNTKVHPIQIDEHSKQFSAFTEILWQKRKHKLTDKAEAQKLALNPLYYAACMVDAGLADGCVAGSVSTTGDVIRAAIRVLGLKKDTSLVSSTFLMAMPDGAVFTYADCGVVPYPDAAQLADIATTSAQTHRRLTQQEPRVALLSFSTHGSAPHPRSQLVADALGLVRKNAPGLIIDGELQFDAAFVPEVARRKAPDSPLKGQANVFIFPNLDAANIAYKITERLAGAGATGPILQGLAKPMMDLSRGCDGEDIVNAACVAILMGED